jgi:general secretion pathway protein K
MKGVVSCQSSVVSGGRAADIGGRSAFHSPLCNEHGVILIALIWILTALSVIALSFSRESFVEVAAARNAQSLESSYFVARAGIAETIYRLIQKRFTPVVNRPELQETPDPLDLGTVTGEMGGGSYRVDIQDESGKVNVNAVSEEQLRLLVEAAGIGKPDSDIITDSILDWRDADSMHRLNGAEDDYYESLNPPYKAKNGRIDTVEELLLVRGVTPEYFYGFPARNQDGSVVYRYGLSRYLTAYSVRNQVNVNFAPVPVLLSIPQMTPQLAQLIYERRRTKPFKNPQEIMRELPMNVAPNAMTLLTTEGTGVYTLTASAYAPNSKVRRVIRTVIALDGTEKTQYRTLYWNENVPDYEGIRP